VGVHAAGGATRSFWYQSTRSPTGGSIGGRCYGVTANEVVGKGSIEVGEAGGSTTVVGPPGGSGPLWQWYGGCDPMAGMGRQGGELGLARSRKVPADAASTTAPARANQGRRGDRANQGSAIYSPQPSSGPSAVWRRLPGEKGRQGNFPRCPVGCRRPLRPDHRPDARWRLNRRSLGIGPAL
jgi:hypothetical protein